MVPMLNDVGGAAVQETETCAGGGVDPPPPPPPHPARIEEKPNPKTNRARGPTHIPLPVTIALDLFLDLSHLKSAPGARRNPDGTSIRDSTGPSPWIDPQAV
jgi:hypothetical protein